MSDNEPPMPEPMPPRPPLLRQVIEGLNSSLSSFQAGAFQLGGVGRHPMPIPPGLPKRCAYTVREPELIREVLVERPQDFPKARLMTDMLESLIGSSIFVANGENWRWRRAVIDPALQQARVTAVFQRMREAADESVAKLLADGRRGPVRVDQEVTLFAADVIFRTIFSEPVPPKTADRIIRAFERFQRLAYPHGMAKQLHIPMAVMPGALIKALAARSIRQALKAPLDRRLRAIAAGEETPSGDIAASLIAGTDPVTGKRFGQRQLLEEVSMFFLAGHETSAAALGWSLYLLATHPQVQDRVLAEVRETVGERPLEFSDIKRLVLTRNVFREAMRLYPPGAVITRDAARCEHMADRDIEPDSLIFVTPWIMHRQARFWNNPNSFDPDRFEDETVKPAIRDAYMPFSMGPRVCPGAAFALQEGALLLAMAVRAARFEPAPGHRPAPIARLTLRSANGVLLKVSPRTDRTP